MRPVPILLGAVTAARDAGHFLPQGLIGV